MARKDYKITIYLGKELYEGLHQISETLQLPLASTTRLLLNTGFQFSKVVDAKANEQIKKGERNTNASQ